MFARLKNLFYIDDPERLDLKIRYGKIIDDQFRGINYHYVNLGEYAKLMFGVIPEQYRKDFAVLRMETNHSVSPHVDSNILTVINFYIETGNCQTNFFRTKDGTESFKLPGQTNGSMYKRESMDRVDGFISKKHEAWVLDVTIPYSIDPLDPGPVYRLSLTMQTGKHSFEQVKEMLAATGNL